MRIYTKIPVLLLSAAALAAALTVGPELGRIAGARQAGGAQPPAPGGSAAPAPKLTALVGGKIRTMADGSAAPFEGVVLIRDGVIEAAGPSSAVTVPDEAEIINVAGMTVTPGLIDTHGSLWLGLAERREQASDSSLDLRDAIDPYDASWKEVARQGVTSVYAYPPGFSGGPGALLRVGPARGRPDQAIIEAGLAAHALPSGTNSVARFEAVNRVRSLLDSAKSYGEAFKKYEEEKKKAEEAKTKGSAPKKEEEKKGEAKKEDEKKPAPSPSPAPPGGRPFPFPRGGPVDEKTREEMIKKFLEMRKARLEGSAPAGSSGPKAPAKDFGKDALLKVVNKQVPIRVEVRDDDTIRHLLKLADDLKIKLVLEGLGKPGPALKEAIDRRIPLILGPMLSEAPASGPSALPGLRDLPTAFLDRFPDFAPVPPRADRRPA